jgi:hypothetical protein
MIYTVEPIAARLLKSGDIIRFKNKESRLITQIDYNPHKSEPYAIRTVDLHDGGHSRLSTYTALDPVIILDIQGEPF